ncbi:hypothetical protein CVT24_000544 [Panaeolus cyanescens]|uniref:Uncharacterized protein n=1 Tax=Panaeolus cyanescens TaxID=181874 RepID=A0A409VDE1_9AGAR|nr:hypothetical protein CVT24_000544 [Panaeolus cyanescens]
MTEYDFSPEAYERYIATQNRIANWVQKTERHRSEFQHAVPTGQTQQPQQQQQHHSHHQPHSSSHHQRTPLYITPPAHDDNLSDYSDDDSYDRHHGGPGPMPLRSAPPVLYQHQQQLPHNIYQPHPVHAVQPMMSPPAPLMLPQPYLGSPHRSSSSSRKHKSSRSRSHQPTSTGYYAVASPPVSPGYQYAYPQMTGGHPGYIMIQPQSQQQSRAMPMMPEDIPLPPRSAPPNVPTFTTTPATPQTPSSQGYFHIPVPGTGGYLVPATSPLYSAASGTPASAPAWSIYGSPASTPAASFTAFSPPQSPYYLVSSIPAYQGLPQTASPAPSGYLVPAQPQPYVVNQPAAQPSTTSKSSGLRHWFRRSVG